MTHGEKLKIYKCLVVPLVDLLNKESSAYGCADSESLIAKHPNGQLLVDIIGNAMFFADVEVDGLEIKPPKNPKQKASKKK